MKDDRKRTLRRWAPCLLTLLLALAACQQPSEQKQPFSLDGAWTLRHISYAMGEVERDYPHEGHTQLSIYGPDSALYVCGLMEGPSGQTVVPGRRAIFTLIDKGGGEHLYVEDGEPRPLTILDDSTVTIQRFGTRYTWVRCNTLPPRRVDKIRQLIAEADLDNDQPCHYVFSAAEEELKAENSVLTYSICGTLILLLAVAFFAREAHLRRQSVERQLEQLRCERDNRPQRVAEAMKSTEDEFFASDYYLALLRDIERGRLTEAQWREAEERAGGVWPGFWGRLSGLHRLSLVERRVCLLTKLRIPPTSIASVLCKDVSTVSSTRSRLFQKVFARKGSARDWDEFILSL